MESSTIKKGGGEQEKESSGYVGVKSGMKRQFFVCIAVAAAVAVVVSLIISLATATLLAMPTKTTLSELEEELRTTQAELDATKEALNNTSSKLAELEDELSSTKMKTSELENSYLQLSRDHSSLQARAEDLEKTLRNTTARTMALDVELDSVKSDLASLNATKASKVSMGEISDMVAQLNKDKVERTEFSQNLSSLRESTSRTDEILQEKIGELEERLKVRIAMQEEELNSTKNRISRLELNHQELFTEFTHSREELNNTTSAVLDAVEHFEERLTNTTDRVLTFEIEMESLKSDIASLNATKASNEALNRLTDNIVQLERKKVDRTEFEVLSANLTSLAADTNSTLQSTSELESELRYIRGKLNETEEALGNVRTKAEDLEHKLNNTVNRTSTLELRYQELFDDIWLTREELNSTSSALQGSIEDWEEKVSNTTSTLEVELNIVRSDIATVNATKASREEVSQQVAQLDRDKVDRTEFQELSANVTSLAETSSREDEELQQELRELSESALNHTHYNQIQQDLASKASQVEVELLANSTVRTTTFLQRVEGIENTIVQVQWNISQLTFNLTHLEGRVQQINITLETKATQQDFNTLSTKVTSLEGSTVDKDTFQKLNSTVQSIQETKANETDLSQLKKRVDSLSTNTATKSALNGLDKKLGDHISSSDETHRGLSSNISRNSDSISGNTDRISQIEKELSSSSVDGLTTPWLTIAVSVSVTLVAVCRTTHAY